MSAGTLSNNTHKEKFYTYLYKIRHHQLSPALSPHVFHCKAATEGTGLVNSAIDSFFPHYSPIFSEKEPSF